MTEAATDTARLVLSEVRDNWRDRDTSICRATLAAAKEAVLAGGEQEAATEIWCMEQALDTQDTFIDAFRLMKNGDFYNAWCVLEQVELTLGFLHPHLPNGWKFGLDFISDKTTAIQKLYPYKFFFSPEFLEREKKCNICDAIVSIRQGCGHVVGEVYDGKMAIRIVTKMDILGIAAVERPLQKYSVAFLHDPDSGKPRDHYDYTLPKYLSDRLADPFHDWAAELIKVRHPHSFFEHIGKYEPCPCESGIRYKFCCFKEAGVLRPHWQFTWAVQPPTHLRHVVFTGYDNENS
jgi:hypothetical protein